MNMLSLTGVSKSVNDVVLFRDVTLGVDEGEKIGFVGRNGSGKTTLLRILAGDLLPDNGTVAGRNGLRVATVEQRPAFDRSMTLDDFLFAGDSPVIALLREYEHALALTAEGRFDEKRLADLTHRMEERDGFTAEHRFQSVCRELGIVDTSTRMTALSGGMIRKASLARALISDPDLLLLDEPTNHLDIETIEWLEQNLRTGGFAFLIVTHDRYFLDAVCDSIIEIDGSSVYKYEGNWSRYLERKAEREAVADRAEERRIAILRGEFEWLKRGPRARTGKDKGRKARAQELIEGERAAEDSMAAFSSSHSRLGKKVLELQAVSKKFGKIPVIDSFSYEFRRGERIGVIGPNGSGKTTLLEMVSGRLPADSGRVTTGETTLFGYLDQIAQRMDETITVLEFIRGQAERIAMADGATVSAEQFLERFLFPRSMFSTTLNRLSGGELRRLSLIRMLATSPNFLLLDEPTNDLDIDTIRLLEEYLAHFGGCILLVSHDRALLDRLTEYLFVFEGNGRIRKWVGSYAAYRDEVSREKAERDRQTRSRSTAKSAAGEGARPERRKAARLSFKEQKEYERIIEEIEALEKEKAELEQSFTRAAGDGGQLERNTRRYGELTADLEAKVARWEELAERSGEM